MDRDEIEMLVGQITDDPQDSGEPIEYVCRRHLQEFATLIIADFLERSGQYVTNDASRDAAIAEAVAAEREACIAACQSVIDSGEYDGRQQYAAAACRNAIRARS